MNRLYLIAGLSLALCISLGINFWQILSRAVADAEAPLKAQLAAMEQADAINAAVAEARLADGRELERMRAAVVAAEGQTRAVYRDRIRTLPAASCAPGADRVAAWNAIAQGAAK